MTNTYNLVHFFEENLFIDGELYIPIVLSALVILAVNGLLSNNGVKRPLISGFIFFLLTGDSHFYPKGAA